MVVPLLGAAACGISVFGLESASALEFGPVAVGESARQAVTVATPPSVVPVSASATIAPTGIAIDTTLPGTVAVPGVVGPVALPAVVPRAVNVATDGSRGAGVAVSVPLPSLPSATNPAVSPAVVVPAVVPDARIPWATRPSARSATAAPSSIAPKRSSGAQRSVLPTRAAPRPIAPESAAAVSASLRYPAPGIGWTLLRAATSAYGLWLALVAIGFAARALVGGLVRDALRRRPVVSAS